MLQHDKNTDDAVTDDPSSTKLSLEKKEDSTTHKSSTDSIAVNDITVIRQRLKRKLDIRLAIWAFMGFFAMFLDKSNLRMYIMLYHLLKEHTEWKSVFMFIPLANAYVSGMREDLDLESSAYNWADAIMSIGLNMYMSKIPLWCLCRQTDMYYTDSRFQLV